MRYGPERKEQTRRRIVEAAGRRFREDGYRAAGVDHVMASAGLTAGGFYSHFDSKEALLAEAIGFSLEGTRSLLLAGLEDVDGADWLCAAVGRYLSRTHRDNPGAGCSLPALASEIAREGELPRAALQDYIQRLVAEVAPRTPPRPGLTSEDRLLATAALLAGALMLARAVPDEAFSNRILRAARRFAVPETAETAAAAEKATRRRRPPR